MILNKISWKVNLSSPADLANILINECINDDKKKEEIKETFNDWMGFCLNESSIYYKYNQYEITLASLYLSYKTYKIKKPFNAIKKLFDLKIIKTISKKAALYNDEVENISDNISYKCDFLGSKRLRDSSKNR
jgi:hypothetical protein